jgi:hypothetical protein
MTKWECGVIRSDLGIRHEILRFVQDDKIRCNHLLISEMATRLLQP